MAALNRYSISPFCGDRYSENERKLREGDTPCAICGKAVKPPFKHEATIVRGGDWASTEQEAANVDDPGYMGVWPIGVDCHRKYQVKPG